ncbi:MAG: hypothetical protein LBN32_01470 [Helicobacteraceae bacterium]|nr:hypothetical protein [Helicobacteraceae bacterium]
MKKRIRDSIKWAHELIERKGATEKDINRLERKIAYFQHERLAHLITMVFVGLADMIALVIFIIFSNHITLALLIVLGILFAAYVAHYYALENGVQKLRDLMDKLYE